MDQCSFETHPRTELGPRESLRSWSADLYMMIMQIRYNPMSSMLTPSSMIEPLVSLDNSRILRRPSVRVDFPDPVRPITPTFSLALIWNDMLWMTFSSSALYLKLMLLSVNYPYIVFIYSVLGRAMISLRVLGCRTIAPEATSRCNCALAEHCSWWFRFVSRCPP